ncbi:hypothetical protein HJFPF1_11517 [Paramyrothecium foliicola]|nr:hypothetical protein HJFPF1_11517 [Paramyrothecium foliicola]
MSKSRPNLKTSPMAFKRPILAQQGRFGLLVKGSRPRGLSVCPFCSLAQHTRTDSSRRRTATTQRYQSTAAAASNHREKLQQCLLELEKRFPTLVDISRVQLAVQGLRQPPGSEVVRVAIFHLAGDSGDGKTARSVLRALLADPLSDEQEWETKLDSYDTTRPLIVRVAPQQHTDNALSFATDAVPPELHISSPALNNLNLEFLLMEIDAPITTDGDSSIQTAEETLLAPVVEIPSGEGRFTPITTPVHQALLIADGFAGAVKIAALPLLESQESVLPAVNMPGVSKEQLDAPFEIIDVARAGEAVRIFRQGPQHGMQYERLWTASNLPDIVAWLKSNNAVDRDGTKPAVRKLVASILQNSLADIQLEESRNLSRGLVTSINSAAVQSLNRALADWSQQAHTELQAELDAAFTGRRWRKLGWWKLFWRVDDVGMLTSEMLSQRFLPTAEQELVYLTGRVAELGGGSPRYSQPVSSEGQANATLLRKPGSDELSFIPLVKPSTGLPKWPGHITFTRRYLQNETVPALQSLAQRLVMQALGFSSLTTSLAALLYVSSFASTLYEAGAVAALGVVYSLNRLQNKWETAREFWEGEAREEGRKAVRAAEASVAEVLAQGESAQMPEEAEARAEELQKARTLVAEAEDALARMK